MTLGEADGVGAGAGAGGAGGVAVLALLGAGPAAGWAEGPAQPAARMASPAARAVRVFAPGPGHRLRVIGRPPLPDPRCWIPSWIQCPSQPADHDGPGVPRPAYRP